MRIIITGFITLFLSSCASVDYEVASPTETQIKNAVSKIKSVQLAPIKKRSDKERDEILEEVKKDLLPAAASFCNNFADNKTKCRWSFETEDIDEFNAYASESNTITIYTGLIDRINDKEELAFVLAHEMAHHMADHIQESTKNQTLGFLVGMAAGYATTDKEDYETLSDYDSEILDMATQGSNLAELTYSRDQESEADLFALGILKAANYDLEKARIAVLRLGKLDSGSSRSSFFDTHPSGPERLAKYDNNLNEAFIKNIRPVNQLLVTESNSTDSSNSGKTVSVRLSYQMSGICFYQYKDITVTRDKEEGCPKYVQIQE